MKEEEWIEIASRAEDWRRLLLRGLKWAPYLPVEHLTENVLLCIGMYEACVEMSPTFRFVHIPPKPNLPSSATFAWFAEYDGLQYAAGLSFPPTPRDFGNLILQAYQSLKIVTERAVVASPRDGLSASD